LLDHAQATHGNAIELDDFLYWYVQREELVDPAREPTALTLGAVADDWAEISAIAAGAKPPIGYALVWASTLLRAIGDRTP
jgi:hypothetical protein